MSDSVVTTQHSPTLELITILRKVLSFAITEKAPPVSNGICIGDRQLTMLIIVA